MKKVIAIVVVVIILAGGGYAIFHKSNKPATNNNNTSKATVAPVNNAVVTTKSNGSIGQYFVAANGMALYTYGGDTSGASNVSGSLLASWPAYQATGSTANLPSGFSTIKRTDNGQTQYTYNGMPLYFFTSDSAGQVTGDGVANFNVAKPAASTSGTQSTATPTPTATADPASSGSSPSSGYPY